MSNSKFFNQPFDEESLLKLEIYKDYVNEWLPVFISKHDPVTKTVNIFDFFSGAGTDSAGKFGSPLIVLEALNTERYLKDIEEKSLTVNLYFNDHSKPYIQRLTNAVQNYNYNTNLINVHISCKDFTEAYSSLKGKMYNAANLVFLDQFGIKYVDRKIFRELARKKMTDILFFISSSHFNRHYDSDGFRSILNFTKEEIKSKDFFRIHNIVMDKYREFLPPDLQYYLAPFSIKKVSTINGLIFGSSHLLGIEKFLKVGWSKDNKTGEANFDIDKEKLDMYDGTLFHDAFLPKKLELFEQNLEKKILDESLKTEKDVYIYTVQNGCLPNIHAKPRLKKMKENGIIAYEGKLALTYSSLFGNKERITKSIKVK